MSLSCRKYRYNWKSKLILYHLGSMVSWGTSLPVLNWWCRWWTTKCLVFPFEPMKASLLRMAQFLCTIATLFPMHSNLTTFSGATSSPVEYCPGISMSQYVKSCKHIIHVLEACNGRNASGHSWHMYDLYLQNLNSWYDNLGIAVSLFQVHVSQPGKLYHEERQFEIYVIC